MELKDTVESMLSEDYKERFLAEYNQTRIRYEKLKSMCEAWDAGKLNFEPTCPRGLYSDQLHFMKCYLGILETRAIIEGVKIEDVIVSK